MVKGQRRRDDVAGRQGIVIGAFLEADLVSIPRKTVARPLKHLRINVEQFGFAERSVRQNSFRQRSGSRSEFKQQAAVPYRRRLFGDCAKHRIVTGNKIAYRMIEVVDFNAQMSTH